MKRDRTLITTKEAAVILGRKEAMTRRLFASVPPIFKTAKRKARDWFVEKWEVEEYAATHPKQTHKNK